MREELRGIQIEAHVLAEALRLQQCEKHEFILFLLVGLPLELQQMKLSCEMLYVKCREHNQARSPRRPAVVASPFYEKQKKESFCFNKNISTFPTIKMDVINYFCTDMKRDLVCPFS